MFQPFWMLAAAVLFTLMAACTKWGAADYGTFALVFWRSLIGLAALGVWIAASGRTIRTRYFLGHVKRSFIGTSSLVIWFWVLGRLPLETAMTLNYTSPLYMAAYITLLHLRRGLPADWPLSGSIIAGFLGVLLVLQPSVAAGQHTAVLIGLSCGFLSCWAMLQVRELSAMHEPTWRIVFYFTLMGVIAGLCGSFFEPRGLAVIPTFRGIAPLLGVGLFGILAQLCLTRAFGGGNILLTSALQFSAIVFSAIMSAVAFGSPISASAVFGIALIIAAGTAATYFSRRGWKKLEGDAADRS
ncbi:MAG: DMT family transporter [Mesosutterella sp.]|nr:DMT family transporter [Mesosutterella sp.]